MLPTNLLQHARDRHLHCEYSEQFPIFVVSIVLRSTPTHKHTLTSLLTTLCDGKPAEFLVGFLNGRYRTQLKADVVNKLGAGDKTVLLISNAQALSGSAI